MKKTKLEDKIIFFLTDFMGEYEDDLDSLESQLLSIGIEIDRKKFIHKKNDTEALERNFDVLFFDWGGASLGNSILEHYCGYILKHAEENPSKFYIMASRFTGDAMKDMIEEFKDKEKPANLIIDIQKEAELVKLALSNEE